LYKGFENTFITENVNDFIEKIKQVIDILKNIYNKLFPSKLIDPLFKNFDSKISLFNRNNVYLIIISIIGYLNNKTSKTDIEKSIEKGILYHILIKDISNKDRKEDYKKNDEIKHVSGGNYIDTQAEKIYKTPNLISEKITPEIMDKVINTLIQQNTKNIPYLTRSNGKDKKDKRKNRPYYEIILMLNYFKHKVPYELLSNTFWLEHLIPFSCSWVEEIDIDRFGNTIPIIDKINNKRKNKHIKVYSSIEEQINTNFIIYLKNIIPDESTYNLLVDHNDKKPKVINKEQYDLLCIKNEEEYKNEFLKYLFN
jgi:hypothetical protein